MKNVFRFLGIAFVACSMLVACGDDTETFTIKVKANDSSMGTVTGGGKYENGATATLEATPNAGYVFVDWEDGSKNNPRIVTVTADAEYTANFAVQAGVKVQFGEATWNAEYINAQTNMSAYLISAAQTNANDYPFAYFLCNQAPATGTMNATCSFDMTAGTASAGDPRMWYFDEEPQFTFGGNSAASWWANDLTVNVSAFDADALTISYVANGTAMHVVELFDGADWNSITSKAMTMTVTNVKLTSVKGLDIPTGNKIALK